MIIIRIYCNGLAKLVYILMLIYVVGCIDEVNQRRAQLVALDG